MGCIASQPSFITSSNGTLDDYQKRYLETKTLGEGEFGVVKLAHDVTDKDLVTSKPLAVKYLRKGFQFKDNTLYTPIKKDVLVGEVEILRRLNGECYNLTVRQCNSLYHAYNTGLTVDLQNIAYFSVRNAIFDSTGD